MKRTGALAAAILAALAVFVVACAGTGRPGVDAQATPRAGSTATPDDTLSLASREAGLDTLKSYRMHWQADWKSTEGAKAETASWDWTEERSSEPKGRHWIWKYQSSGNNMQGNTELWQVGDTTYIQNTSTDGKTECSSFSGQDEKDQMQGGIFNPGTLGSLSDASYVGSETVNGIKARHFRYDEKGASLAGFSKVNGEVWVAEDGGFVVKDVLAWEGSAGSLGIGSQASGSGKWTWELSHANQPIAISSPQDCGGAAGALPVLQGATDRVSAGDMLTYRASAGLSAAVDFYTNEMPKAGWQPDGDPQVSEEFAALRFKKDGDHAGVNVMKDGDGVQVMISLEKSE